MANHYNARVDNKVEYWIRDKLEDLENFDGIYIYIYIYTWKLILFLRRTISAFAVVGDTIVLLFLVITCF